MANSVIIVAGGSGNRFGSDMPKQFLNLKGVPILMRTIQVFFDFDATLEIIVVLPKDQFDFWQTLCTEHNFAIAHKVVAGGAERFYSVKNGVTAVTTIGVIAIHDAVRPLVSESTLQNCFATAAQKGTAVPVIPSVDSIREVDALGNNQPVSRDTIRLVQTPQCFGYQLIQQAFLQDYIPEFTDDASVAEKAGYTINLVEGNRENIKITTPFDLRICEGLI